MNKRLNSSEVLSDLPASTVFDISMAASRILSRVTFHLVSASNIIEGITIQDVSTGGYMRKITVVLIVAGLLSLTSVEPVAAGGWGGGHHGRGGVVNPLWPIAAALTIPAAIIGTVVAATVPQTYGYAPQTPETYYAPGAYYAPRAYVAPMRYYAPRVYVAPTRYYASRAYAAPMRYYAPRAYAAPTPYYAPRGYYP